MFKKKLATGVAIAVICLASVPLAAHGMDDTEPPSISNVDWQPEHPDESDTITVSATVTDDSGVAEVNLIYCYDGTCYPPVAMSGSSGSYAATIGPFDEGMLTFNIEAEDTVGNSGQTQEYSLFVDGTAPHVSLLYPDGGEYLSGTVDVEWSVSDNGDDYPDIEVSYRNNGAWQTIDSIPDAHTDQISWDTTGVADGAGYQARVTAVDDAGNTAQDISSSTFTVDNTPPSTTVDLDGEENGDWYGSNVTVTLNATDATSGVSEISYQVDNGTWNTYTDPFTLTENGEHNVSFYAVDNAGNEEAEQSVAVNIDKRKPSLAVFRPVEGRLYLWGRDTISTVSGTTVIVGDIRVEVNATDNVSGMDRVEFYVDGELQNTSTQAPYTWLWDDRAFFRKTLRIVAYNNAGNTAEREIQAFVLRI